MNKLLLAVLFLTISLGNGLQKEITYRANKARQKYAKANNIADMKDLTYSKELEATVKKICKECPTKDEIKADPGYKVYAIDGKSSAEIDRKAEETVNNPASTEFAVCTPTSECKNFKALVIINSGNKMGYTLMIIMAIVLVFVA